MIPDGPVIPQALGRNVVDVHGADGADWLERFPATLAEFADRWSLDVLPPFDPLSYNYAAPAVRCDGTAAVLKAGVPCREIETEVAALALYAGRGAVRLLEAEVERGVMLLERAVPGAPLRWMDDEDATVAAAEVMRRIWRPVPGEHPFPTVADWTSGLSRLREKFEGGTGPFPAGAVENAETLFEMLLDSMDEPVVLHGDAHHWNILAATREPYLAIDPKGVVGEPAYEVGAFLRNPMRELLDAQDPVRLLSRRVDIFEQRLGIDRSRMIQWAFAQAILSAWWFYEDHEDGWRPALELADIIAQVS